VRCWFAPHKAQGGKKLHEQIDEAICIHDKLLLILSCDSIHSEWVRIEISKARKLELRGKRRIMFPLRLVDFEALQQWECWHSDLGDLAEEIRQYYIPDFSRWKADPDQYKREFDRLVRDLQAPV